MSADRRRVLHVIPYMHPSAGGPPVVVDRVSRQFLERDWAVSVLSTDQYAPTGDPHWAQAYLPVPIRLLAARDIHCWPRDSVASNTVDEAVTGASLVHLHGLWSSLNRFAARACLRQQVPFVVMPHGMLDPHSLRRKRLKKWLFGHMIEWPLLRRATGMIYTHPEEQRLAESAVRGLPPGHVVSLAADDPPEMDREAMAEGFFDDYPQLRGRKLVIFLSRLHEKKGLDLLIPAFADVARRDPACHLVIVGQGEDRFVDTIQRRVAAANLESRVTFTGPRSGAAKWSALAAGTVMALPSYQENFALVVAEAMAVGLPVVLSGRVNICEDVVRAGAGLECMLQPKSIAESLERFLNDAGFRERAGEAGRTLVRERFTWQRSAAAMEQVYARLLGGTPVAPSNPTPSPFGIP